MELIPWDYNTWTIMGQPTDKVIITSKAYVSFEERASLAQVTESDPNLLYVRGKILSTKFSGSYFHRYSGISIGNLYQLWLSN